MSKFCSSCGSALAAGAGFCSSCGGQVLTATAPVTPQQHVPQQPVPQQPGQFVPLAPKVKTKTNAILLAVFFGYWAWLYTFKRDKLKFFVGLGVGLVANVVALVSYLLNYGVQQQLIQCYTRALLNGYDLDLCNGYKTNYVGVWIGVVIAWGVWLWAVIDTARKKNDFFTNYPNGI